MAQDQIRAIPRFYMAQEVDEKASAEAGRPIHKMVERIEIRFIGDKYKIIDEPAHARTKRDRLTNQWISYIEEYPEHYKAFKRNEEYIGEGTPISEAPFLTMSERADLKAINIHTVEALANLDQAGQRRIGMAANAMVSKAKAYIENASGSAGMLALASQNAQMKEQLERMQQQMAELMQKQAAAAPAPVAPPSGDDDDAGVSNSVFATWDDATLKAYIKDKTGNMPRGNPSHETLVRMADEANAASRSEAA